MKVVITVVILFLIGSLSLNTYLLLDPSDSKMNLLPPPESTTWIEVFHDESISIINDEESVNLKYDTDSRKITVDGRFRTVIAWEEGLFVNMVTYGPISSGAELIRVNTESKKVVYMASLCGIGPQTHSQYGNSVRVYKNEGLIMVVGNETHGDYREIRRIKDGSLVIVDQSYKNLDLPNMIEIK